MNSQIFLGCLLIMCACMEKNNSQTQIVHVEKVSAIGLNQFSDTLAIDLSQSSMRWKGTKMRGLGKHEGKIDLASGFLLLSSGMLEGGQFLIDMASLSVTDIPEHEPVPRNNLNNHLKSEDFFDVATFPKSKFEITGINYLTADSLSVTGDLTLKDVTKSISFIARERNNQYLSTFKIDRFLWNVAYEGNWTDRTFVDKDIEFRIKLVTQ